ncbi:ureidoglycolate lyase [Paenochrobactrum sp. BZR 588]|uniref:ureidoglycolate lyase n=1 Tax=unclassified Paenochrobactrum TaxID=2639760 RepID=UPI003854D537
MQNTIKISPLTAAAFAPFGDILCKTQAPSAYHINQGNCLRHHDLARVEATGTNARVLINIFSAKPYQLPLQLNMMERHPYGSQAFMPLSGEPFLVIVAHDSGDGPARPQAFITQSGQGINIHRNVWHGVLTPLNKPCDFLVVDRGGDENNLQEFFFPTPYLVE